MISSSYGKAEAGADLTADRRTNGSKPALGRAGLTDSSFSPGRGRGGAVAELVACWVAAGVDLLAGRDDLAGRRRWRSLVIAAVKKPDTTAAMISASL
jgi:hypothetical protein